MRLQKLFPKHEGLGASWRAHILQAILTFSIPITFLVLVLFLLVEPFVSFEVLLLFVGVLFQIGVWLIWKRVGLVPASFLLVLGSSVITSICIYYSGGIASVVLVAQALVIVMTALLSSPRVTLAMVLAITGFNVFLLYGDGGQLLRDPLFNDEPAIRFLLQTAILVITAGTISYSTRVLWALTRNLELSEYRFRALFEQTSDAVFITGLNLRVLEINEQAARLLAYAPRELVGKPVKRLFPTDEWEEVQQRFESVKKHEHLSPTTRRFLTKHGDELMLETNLSLVQDLDGQPLHYQSTGRDVTLKVMEDQRIKSTLVSMTVKASTDSLTGTLNRETIQQHAEAEWERYAREGRPMSLVLMDMDGLKRINDSHGHNSGDLALNTVARVVEQFKRPYDWFGRYGGDEFLLVLPGTGVHDARSIARRMRAAVNKERLRVGKRNARLSCSFGVSSTEGHTPPIRSITELIELADVALYKEKRNKK